MIELARSCTFQSFVAEIRGVDRGGAVYHIPVGLAMVLLFAVAWAEPQGVAGAIFAVGCFVLISMAVLIYAVNVLPARIADAMRSQAVTVVEPDSERVEN